MALKFKVKSKAVIPAELVNLHVGAETAFRFEMVPYRRIRDATTLVESFSLPSESATGGMAQSESAEVDLAIRAEGGTVHQPNARGPVKVPQILRSMPAGSVCPFAGPSKGNSTAGFSVVGSWHFGSLHP